MPARREGFEGFVIFFVLVLLGFSGCLSDHCEVYPEHCVGVADEVGSTTGSETGGSGSSTDSIGSSDSSSDSTDEGMTTESTESMTESTSCACLSDLDCGVQSPVCDCECVACTAENGALCKDDWMACDADQDICVDCADCVSGVCNHSTGQCIDGIHVDGDGGKDFLSIEDALTSLNGQDGTIILHETVLDPDYLIDNSSFSIDGVDISIVAAQGESPSVDSTAAIVPYLFEVSNGGTLYLAGFDIGGKRGIFVQSLGAVHLVSMNIITEQKSLVVNSGHATVSNSMLTSTDGAKSVIEMLDGTQLDVTFSTIYNPGTMTALDCPAAPMNISLTARNSIIANTGMSATDCPFEMDWGNLIQASVDCQSWFVDATDLHLVPPGQLAAAGLATWGLGDPTLDIDGDDRPQAMFSTYAGADVP